jgi:serine/threonine-protein kinase
MTNCVGHETLVAFLDDRLGEAEREALEAHVEGCRACAGALKRLTEPNQRALPFPAALLAGRPAVGPGREAPGSGWSRSARGVAAEPSAARENTSSGDEAGMGLAGRYQLAEEVGRGGMGAVHRGHDCRLGRDLAVKVLLRAYRGNAAVASRFNREAQLCARLQHPGVVPLYELGELPDGRPFFTMRLVEGRTLADLLAGRSAPSDDLPRWLAVFLQVCQVVAYAHSKAVVHRDLKPANVMVGAFGEVQVMDWGLAKDLDAADETWALRADGPAPPPGPGVQTVSGWGETQSLAGTVLGTPAYMPPEQARGEVERLDRRADVFGLGAILSVTLTGKPPYTAEQGDDLLGRARQGDLAEALGRLDSCGADAELAALAKECLAPDPLDRPADAAVVAARVAAYQAGVAERLREAELGRATAQARAAGEAKRRRLALALAAAVLALVLLGAGGYAWVAQQRAERRVAAAGAIDLALARVAELRGRAAAGDPSGWGEAQAEARRAADLLEQAEAEPVLRARVAAVQDELERARGDAEAERRLVARLEAIRSRQSDRLDARWADQAYAEAFREFGLDLETMDPREAGSRLAGRAATAEIASALDEWCRLRRVALAGTHGARPWQRLAEVARAADPDPWRNALRSMAGRPREEAVAALRKQADDRTALGRQPAASLVLLARMLKSIGEGEQSAAVLQAAWGRFPGDFWVNYNLGASSWSRGRFERPSEAVRFLTGAVAARPGSAVAHSDLGLALRDHGDRAGQIAAYRRALALDPKYAPAHNNLGVVLIDNGDLQGAIASIRQALAFDPNYAPAHTNLGYALNKIGDPAGAIAAFRWAIALDPNYAPAHNNLGVALSAKGDREAFMAAFRQAIALDPEYAKAYTNLGNALRESGDLAEAIAAHRRAIGLNPKYAKAHTDLGKALRDQGDLAGAIATHRRAIALDPKYAPAHTNLGVALGAKGDLAGAIAAFRRAIALDPKHPPAHTNLGNALRKQQDLVGAIAAFRRAIALDPNYAPAHTNLGAALVAKGDLEGAITAFRRAIAVDPKYAPAHYSLRNTLYAKKDLAGAFACYRQAIAVAPKDANAHTNLGVTLSAKGDLEGAIAAFRQAIALAPKHPAAHYNLGLAFQKKGQLEEAITAYRKAIDLQPGHAEAHCNLGQVLLRQGRLADSLASLRRGHELGQKRASWPYPSARWVRDAQRLVELDRKLPAVLAGEAKPADASESVGLAQLCQQVYQRRYVASARLYAEAFAANPGLAADRRASHRYNAARAAALAAASQGIDAANLDPKERARLRRQALDWLRADLAAWARVAEQADPQARQEVKHALTCWRRTPDLSGLRDKAKLDQLPESERQACRDLWAEVDAVFGRVGSAQ